MYLTLGIKYSISSIESVLNKMEWKGVDERYDLERKGETPGQEDRSGGQVYWTSFAFKRLPSLVLICGPPFQGPSYEGVLLNLNALNEMKLTPNPIV